MVSTLYTIVSLLAVASTTQLAAAAPIPEANPGIDMINKVKAGRDAYVSSNIGKGHRHHHHHGHHHHHHYDRFDIDESCTESPETTSSLPLCVQNEDEPFTFVEEPIEEVPEVMLFEDPSEEDVDEETAPSEIEAIPTLTLSPDDEVDELGPIFKMLGIYKDEEKAPQAAPQVAQEAHAPIPIKAEPPKSALPPHKPAHTPVAVKAEPLKSASASVKAAGKHDDKKHGDKHADKKHGDKKHADKKPADKKHADKKHADKKHSDKKHADKKGKGHGKKH